MRNGDGTFPAPKPEDLNDNPEYLSFKQQYGIELNKQQERAVQSIAGANLLLAVPGSGKTTVLIARIGYMVHCKHISPNSILARLIAAPLIIPLIGNLLLELSILYGIKGFLSIPQ